MYIYICICKYYTYSCTTTCLNVEKFPPNLTLTTSRFKPVTINHHRFDVD